MKKLLISLACVGLAVAPLSACDGNADGADGVGGDASGGSTATGGASSSGGSATGGSSGGEAGSGTGGGGEDEVAAFCTKYETDCGFGEADRYPAEPDCIASASTAAENNPPLFNCRVSHLGYVVSMGVSHCAHAFGSSTCTEAEYPPP